MASTIFIRTILDRLPARLIGDRAGRHVWLEDTPAYWFSKSLAMPVVEGAKADFDCKQDIANKSWECM